MSKAFTRENDEAEDDLPAEQRLPASSKNYITPGGWLRLKDELYQLVNKERPEVVQIVNWAASMVTARKTATICTASAGCVKSTAVSAF